MRLQAIWTLAVGASLVAAPAGPGRVGGAALAQERKIPKDSTLVTLRGCAAGRTFLVAPRAEDAPGTLDIAPGRRFRLSGPKAILDEIRRRERMMVQVTGLVRKSDVAGRGAGGVRIGGGNRQSPLGSAGPDIGYNQAVIDVESWRSLPTPCPAQ